MLNIDGSAFGCSVGVAVVWSASDIDFHLAIDLPLAALGVKGAALAAWEENVDFFVGATCDCC